MHHNSTHIVSLVSYTSHRLFIGLADILLPTRQLNKGEEILDNKTRNKTVASARYWLDKGHTNDPLFPVVQYKCEEDCYGKLDHFNTTCSECINSYTNKDNDTVGVVGAGIHITNHFHKGSGRINSTVQEINAFLDKAHHTIWTSMPSYDINKVPDEYKKSHLWLHKIHTGSIPNVAPTNPDHPFLDVFQLTDSCNMENCSYDGGHRSRYVNRWKAQLLLNTLCEYSDVDGNGENSTNKY